MGNRKAEHGPVHQSNKPGSEPLIKAGAESGHSRFKILTCVDTKILSLQSTVRALVCDTI